MIDMRKRRCKMPRLKNFIVDFQKDHSDLFKLVGSFSKAVKSRNLTQGKEILNKIDSIANGHFLFEETYLYPRLRRLVFEITENLGLYTFLQEASNRIINFFIL